MHNIASMSKDLTIRLDNFSMFTMGVHPGFQYIGRVQRGMEVGALALTPEGAYVQVNGSIVTPLNTSKVLATLRKLPGHGRLPQPGSAALGLEDYLPQVPAQPPAPVPVIVKRKKRTLVMS